jgi:hypothetical protein
MSRVLGGGSDAASIASTVAISKFTRLISRQPRPLCEQLEGRHVEAERSVPSQLRAVEVLVARQPDTASPLHAVFRGHARHRGLAIYVHGSWADDTRTPFSDLDDLVVVDTTVHDRRSLRRLARWLDRVECRFSRLDPLQHHGHWVVEKSTLDRYDDSYMPMVVLEGALRICGPARITANVDVQSTTEGLKRNIDQTIRHASLLLSIHADSPLNAYQFKRFIGSLLILPAYRLQLRGEPASKAEAIARAGELSPTFGPIVMAWCTQVREEWGIVTAQPSMGGFRVLGSLLRNPRIYRSFAARVAPSLPRGFDSAMPIRPIEGFLADLGNATSARQ